METKQRYVIIGTSHVSKDSLKIIKETFSDFKPDIIAVELDRQRLYALMHKEKSKLGFGAIKELGITGYIFALIGRAIQKKIGDALGMNPGEEMLLGANLARNNKLILALIDQDVAVTLRNLSKKVKFKEKFRIFTDLIFSPFKKKEKISFDISRIPPQELIEKLMQQMKDKYPGFYRVLLDDRNRHMARKIFVILRDNPEKKVMAIVGAGHLKGIEHHLKALQQSNVLP